MSNENSPPPTPNTRRASISAGQKISELFGRSPTASGSAAGTSSYPGPIATAAANAQAQQRRRMSISTLGLSGSPTRPSMFGNARARGESISSSGSGSIDENAVEEGDAAPNTSPGSPFARRMSFGAKALRDVRTGSGIGNGRNSTNLPSSPSVAGRGLPSSLASTAESSRRVSNNVSQCSGEGFNWSDQLRSKAERSSSITSPTASTPRVAHPDHQRATSIAAVEPPVREMPRSPKVPDHFQERILKGDFYMD